MAIKHLFVLDHFGYRTYQTNVYLKSTTFWDITQWSGLHGLISQKMVLFITTAVRTSNLTNVYLYGLYFRFHLNTF
jgi:hypothetical protein